MTGPDSLRPRLFDLVVFDLDGVVTDTAKVHARAWKELFDEFLEQDAGGSGRPFTPFDLESDYLAYVDGKPRQDGVRTFLASRRITLPEGHPSDRPGERTVWGLGNRKDGRFVRSLQDDGVEAFPSTVRLVRELATLGVRRGIASSSRNCALILKVAGLQDLFEARVDGSTLAERGLRGKPAPDMFVACAQDLGVEPARAVVVEDAISGVQAGAAGGFALVVGIARHGNEAELRANGADVVVPDLDVTPAVLDAWIASKAGGAR